MSFSDRLDHDTSITRIPADLFTRTEKEKFLQNTDEICTVASRFLSTRYEDHIRFFKQYGVSKYYGNRRRDYSTREGRIRELQRLGKPIFIADLQEGTACILLAMQAVKSGLFEINLDSIWKKIYEILSINNLFLGTDLQIMLQQLGWKIIYWNPSPRHNRDWDKEDRILNPLKEGKSWNPVWGGHYLRYNSVINRGVYSEKRVDNAGLLVDFGENPPEIFKQQKFFIGTAHDGYHVFPGLLGKVFEAHSTRDMDAIDNLEFSPFNPLARGGGPRWTRREKYRSGLIVMPNF